MKKHLLTAAAVCCGHVGLANPALAQGAPAGGAVPSSQTTQTDEAQSADAEVEEIIVTGVNSRLSPSLETFPGSVTVIDQEEINTQISVSTDIGALLAAKVPGFATQSFSASDFGQTMRGRGLAYYVDGMPISNPLRDGGRTLRTVGTSAVAGVEVIRGASALYGNGGNGGAVNYITKRVTGDKTFAGRSVLAFGGSLSNVEDSISPFFQQDIEVSAGGFDLLATGSAEFVGSFFDAEGDRIASDPTGNGGITDSDIYSLYTKAGYTDGDHRIEASYLLYDQEQDTAYGRQILGNQLTGIKTRPALGKIDPRVVNQFSRNEIGQVSYIYSDFFGGTARLQGYKIKNSSLFGFNARRAGGTQSLIKSRKTGSRVDFNNPLDVLGLDGTFLWGAEYIRDRSVQTVNTTPQRIFVPEIDQKNYAAFGQLEVRPVDPLTLQAGIRYDKFDVRVEDFTVLDSRPVVNAQGGELDFNSTVLNFGASYQLAREVTVYGGYSEGFSLPDIGLAIRGTRVTNPLVALRPEPVVIKNFEIGARGNLGFLRYTVAGFRSTSKLGQSFSPDPSNPLINVVVRAPERVWGIEATVDGDLLDDQLHWGGTFTWVRGKRQQNIDLDSEAEWVPLPNDRVPPTKITGHLAYDITPDFPIRLQGIYSGSRNEFPITPLDAALPSPQIRRFGTGNFGEIKPFVTFDLLTSYPVGGGKLSLAVTNLLDKFYFPTAAQLSGNRPERFVPAPGRGFRLSYTLDY